MPGDNIDTPADLHDLLEQARPALDALDGESLMRPKVSRLRALQLTGSLSDNLSAYVGRFDGELSPERATQRKQQLEGLQTRAWVLYAADLQAEELRADTAKLDLGELSARVAAKDRLLIGWARPLFASDPAHAATLDDIARGSGRHDDADDVLRLVKLFRANEALTLTIEAHVDKALLDQAALEATALLDRLANQGGNPARRLVSRAYTAWFGDYDDLMRLGRYLAGREAGANARFPGVYPLARRGGGTGDGEGGAPEDDGALSEETEEEGAEGEGAEDLEGAVEGAEGGADVDAEVPEDEG